MKCIYDFKDSCKCTNKSRTEKFFSYLCALKTLFMENITQPIFDKNTVEFVTVAAELCGFWERAPRLKRREFVDKSLKLLPLLYLKVSLLPECERIDDFLPETFVTESDYAQMRMAVAALLGEKDDYLEVFLDDMAYSDTPIRQSISEGAADIYQALKDFICVYQLGFDRTMNDALAVCREGFAEYWGQRVLNVMRALHEIKYGKSASEDEEAGIYESDDSDVAEEELYEGLDMGDED